MSWRVVSIGSKSSMLVPMITVPPLLCFLNRNMSERSLAYLWHLKFACRSVLHILDTAVVPYSFPLSSPWLFCAYRCRQSKAVAIKLPFCCVSNFPGGTLL